MFKGYVSSDSDDVDDLEAFYCEPPVKVKKKIQHPLPEVQNEKLRLKLSSALEINEKIDLFLKAADEGDLSTLEELISSGLSVDCSKEGQWTPLLKACAAGNSEVVQFLLEHGSNPNLHKELLTPLMVCCNYSITPEGCKLYCLRLLLQHGADVNAKDKYRKTPLMYACENNYNDLVTELLVTPGIDLNLQDKEGLTALFYAVYSNNLSVAEKLKLAGIDLTLKDKYNRTAINFALENGLQEMAKLLGYVEENETIFHEKETEASYRFLEQLPDSNGMGGFTLDVKHILDSLKLKNVKSIGLFDFLNLTDEGLYDIGVKLKPHRKKILSLIHRFHLHPWTKFSIREIHPGVPLSTEDAIAITGDLARNLTLANASLQYLNSRLTSRMDKKKGTKYILNKGTEKDLIIILIEIYEAAEKINVILPKILKHINQIEPEVLDDYIYPYKEKKKNKLLKCIWYICGITAAGFILNAFYPQVVENIQGRMCFLESFATLFRQKPPEPPKNSNYFFSFLDLF